MSNTVNWALKQVRGIPRETKSVLVALANYANSNDLQAFPSVSTMADDLGCSPRTVQRQLKRLRQMGLIELGDQQLVSHYSRDRRPIVYRLRVPEVEVTWVSPRGKRRPVDNPENGVTRVTPRGVTPVTPRGDTGVTQSFPPTGEGSARARAARRAPVDGSAEDVARRYAAERAMAGECPHGIVGGAVAQPSTGKPGCRWCREQEQQREGGS